MYPVKSSERTEIAVKSNRKLITSNKFKGDDIKSKKRHHSDHLRKLPSEAT